MSEIAKTLRVGVIGLGMGRAHIQGWQEHPQVEVVAIADPDAARLALVGDELKVAGRYASAEAMLATEKLDVVSVCTPNKFHVELALAALAAGCHVLCEKPMAMNAAEAQAMLDAAKRNDRLLMIGFVRRFGNDCTIAKDLIEHDRMGDIYYAKTTYLRRNGCPGGGANACA